MNATADECESCAASGQYGIPATTRSANPDYAGYNLCAECAAEYNSRIGTVAWREDEICF